MLRGRRLFGPGQDAQGEVALAAAILVQAVTDARAGCEEAAAWLAHDGANLAELVFDLLPETLAQWRAHAGQRVQKHVVTTRKWERRAAHDGALGQEAQGLAALAAGLPEAHTSRCKRPPAHGRARRGESTRKR